MKDHKHKWILYRIYRYNNTPYSGFSEWACECGAVKEIKFNDIIKEEIG